MKEFLKAIGRKNLPGMNEIAGDEEMYNAYMRIFGPKHKYETYRSGKA